ncbi:MAG: dihydrolipoyl dehydrogenase [Gemmataceae bacterium]
MEIKEVDVAIIGAGTAGLNAMREVEKAGRSWVLIESHKYGTTCARVGCMPSKLLIAAAESAHQVEQSHVFGINAGQIQVDGRVVMERVRKFRDEFAGGVVRNTEALPEERRPRGRARFTGPNTLQVGDDLEVKAKAFVVATGSSTTIPEPFQAVKDDVLTSESIFEIETLPESMAVIGTGVIGLELGQAFSRLGVRVAVYGRSRSLKPFTDPRVQDYAREVLGQELDLRQETTITNVTRTDGGFELTWRKSDGSEHRETFAKILVATGRKSNLADLNLEATGLSLYEQGRPPWNPRTMQCGDHPIFLAGDVSEYRPLLHEAADEGRIAGQNSALYPEVTAHVRRTPLTIVFTDPQMALAGKSFAELANDSIEVSEVSFEDQGRSKVMAVNRGLVRLYAHREDCTLVGAEMFGPRVEHMSHLLAWTIQQRLSVQQILEFPFYHPVFEEGLRTAFREMVKKLKMAGGGRCEERAESAGM